MRQNIALIVPALQGGGAEKQCERVDLSCWAVEQLSAPETLCIRGKTQRPTILDHSRRCLEPSVLEIDETCQKDPP